MSAAKKVKLSSGSDCSFLADYRAFVRKYHGLKLEAELYYQVWSDLERVRQWTNVCVETTETGETVFLRGNAPKSSVEQSCSLADQPGSPADELVLPLRAACMFMPTEIMDQCRRTQVVTGSGLIVAIVADDSTVVYYRLKELDHGLNDLLTVELNYK